MKQALAVIALVALVLIALFVWPGFLRPSADTSSANASAVNYPATITVLQQLAKQTPNAQPTTALVAPTSIVPPPTAAPAPATSSQPQTCGLTFPAYSGGNTNTGYDIRVDCLQDASGWHLRGWQFRLPTNKQSHSVALQIPKGNYTFNGVVCRLYLDETKNGRGSANPVTVANGNNLPFSVGVDVAYALVECDGGTPSGFDYWSR